MASNDTTTSGGTIVIDEAFITKVCAELVAIHSKVTELQRGAISMESLQKMLVKIGAGEYALGTQTSADIDKAGSALSVRLGGYYTTVDLLADGLREFLEEQDQVEDLNKVSAEDITNYIGYSIATGGK